MKKKYIILLLFFWAGIYANAQKLSFDSKYVKVGVMTNEWTNQLLNNPNIRNLGSLSYSYSEDGVVMAKRLTDAGIGKKALDKLFQRSGFNLHMEDLYATALQNTIIEEIEVALQDASAETNDVLKKEIAVQLLKNNYIVLQKTVITKADKLFPKIRIYWQIFHIGIDDRIIEQSFLNWQNFAVYDQIKVPVSFVAKGKSKPNEFIFDIAKKVPAFAIRGSVFNRTPFLARTTIQQGVKKRDRFYVYRFKENRSGSIYSKKVCTARVTEVNSEATRLFSISGKYASTKKGDIAVQRDRYKSSVSIIGQYSVGNDPRYGGRLQYEYLLNFSKLGIAQYFLTAINYNTHKKEPDGIWWNSYEEIQPRLQNVDFTFGYGTGINFLGRIEVMPYILAGYQYSFFSGASDNPTYWNHDREIWDRLTDNKSGNAITSGHAIVGYAGVKLNVNLWYPAQLTIGADYNITASLTKDFKPVLLCHKQNRVNIYTGLRLHF